MSPPSTDPSAVPDGSALARLAAATGVATEYRDWAGQRTPVSADAVRAALAALGLDAATEDDAAAALAEVEARPWRRLLPPATVVVAGRDAGVVVRHPAGTDPELSVLLETGDSIPVPAGGEVVERRDDRVATRVPLPGDLPLGHHRLRARAGDGGTDDAALVVSPRTAVVPQRRSWGWMLQVYAVRSAASWGGGDYADLAEVVRWSGGDGAGVVLCNPLHAPTPVLPVQDSPYSPSSRRFRSPLYLRVEDLPEYARAQPELRAAVDALRPDAPADRVDRQLLWAAKSQALELLHAAGPADLDALAAYRREAGQGLEDFALFCALAERHGPDWQEWPEELRRPDGPGVAAARTELGDRVDLHVWLQHACDQQLAAAGEAARAAGMDVGVVHDLAVGVDAGGADAWALQDVLALGTRVGAPPDSFNQKGQDWGLPPWRPDRLADAEYAPYRDMLRGVLRHAGGLRVDHAMGLSRLWWVPAGGTADQGTYVSYDLDALLGILALEAHRAGAVVVGEDLGTVEAHLQEALADRGVLGSAVLWFERDDGADRNRAPQHWRRLAMASVTTHDLPTAAGFLAEEHVRVRDELGQLGHSVEEERARVAEDREALLRLLHDEGLVAPDAPDEEVVLAMHEVLVRAPSLLVLAALGDAVGDVRQPNLPGTVDEYPNWRLPVADRQGRPLTLEQLREHPGVRRLAALLARGTA